jgi:AcrR family transcriptional regulator
MSTKAKTPSARKPPRVRSRAKGEASRNMILDVSAAIFSTRRYREATMRDIAREVGIAPGGLYFHFKSKDELIAALIERGSRFVYEKVQAALAALPPDASSRDRLIAATHSHIEAILNEGEYSLTMRFIHDDSAPDVVLTEYKALRDAHRKLWMTLIHAAQEDGTLRPDVPPMLVFFYIQGAIGWTPEWYDPKRMSPDRIADYFSMFFLDGLGIEVKDTKTVASPRTRRRA